MRHTILLTACLMTGCFEDVDMVGGETSGASTSTTSEGSTGGSTGTVGSTGGSSTSMDVGGTSTGTGSTGGTSACDYLESFEAGHDMWELTEPWELNLDPQWAHQGRQSMTADLSEHPLESVAYLRTTIEDVPPGAYLQFWMIGDYAPANSFALVLNGEAALWIPAQGKQGDFALVGPVPMPEGSVEVEIRFKKNADPVAAPLVVDEVEIICD